MKSIKFSAIIFLLSLSLIQASHAAPETRSAKSGIQYMTGGIGEEDKFDMRPHAKKFTLNLLFSYGAAGEYITDTNVNIYNEQSELVFRIKAAKPMLYVNLPAGTYTILASNHGERLRHKITIEENKNQKVILNWKDEADQNTATDIETPQ